MSVNKKLKLDKTGGVELKPGSEIGLLLSVVHLGRQKNTYKGEVSIKDQLFLQFELQDVLTDTGLPVTFGKIETSSMKSKANLIKLGEAFEVNLEDGIDFEELVGKAILLDIGPSKESKKIGIRGYNKLPKQLKKEVKPLQGTPRIYLDVENITDSQLSELPGWVVKIINNRVEPGDREDINLNNIDL